MTDAKDDVLDFDLDDLDDDVTSAGISVGLPPLPVGSGNFSYSVNGNIVSSGSFSSAVLASPIEKTRVQYIIVLNDGHTLELSEQQSITAREMIGITKFINTVTSFAMALAAQMNLVIVWSDLVNKLGIQRHFTAGLSVDQYPDDNEVLYIFLTDPT